MRRYATGLQLVLLVCAGATSGYLWRAALDPRSTVAPELVLRGPDPTQLFVKPPTTAGHHPRVREHTRRSVHPQAPAKRASTAVNRHEPRPSAELASVSTPRHTAPTYTGPPQAKPAPSRSKNPNPRTAPPRPKPKARTAPAPTAPPVTTTPPPTTPPPSPPPNPVVTPPVVTPPVPEQAASTSSTRPGWGKGDPNHEHTGPPGQSGKGSKK